MSDLERIIAAILEDDGDTIKDILPDFDEPTGPGSKEGYVERHDRWADIKIGNDHWCISYLTPVAVFIHGQGLFITDRAWGAATSNHIRKWASEIGYSYTNFRELQSRAQRMPQQELIAKFKEESQLVKWTKRQAKMANRLPNIPYGLKSDSDERVEIEPYRE